MKDKETGLTFRTKSAVEKFIAETIVRNNPKYTFAQALRDSNYKTRYVICYAAKIYNNIRVQTVIERAKANLTAKTAIKEGLSIDKVLQDLTRCEEALLENGMLPRRSINAMLKIIELRGKYLAMWTENVQTTDMNKQRELDERDQVECVRIAEIRLQEVG